MTWRWLSKASVLAIHGEQLAEHGGSDGMRDETLLESAIARPAQLVAYGEADAARLAAAYAFGIACNHPFVDGNKRTAFVVAATFVLLNGFDLAVSEQEIVEVFLSLAQGDMTEGQLAQRFSGWVVPVHPSNHRVS
jgi:death-on-curing protein